MKNIFALLVLLLPVFTFAAASEDQAQALNPRQFACAELETTIQNQFFDQDQAVTLTGLNGPTTYVSASLPCPNANQKKVAVGRPTSDMGLGICQRQCFVGFACVDDSAVPANQEQIKCAGQYMAPAVLVPNFAN